MVLLDVLFDITAIPRLRRQAVSASPFPAPAASLLPHFSVPDPVRPRVRTSPSASSARRVHASAATSPCPARSRALRRSLRRRAVRCRAAPPPCDTARATAGSPLPLPPALLRAPCF